MKKYIFAAVILLFVGSGYAYTHQLDIMNSLAESGNVHITEAVPFGSENRQKLNVYTAEAKGTEPTDKSLKPVVVYFYGGNWQLGNRNSFLFAAERLTTLGYTVVIPDYRLYPEVTFPGFVEDGALAVKWTIDNIKSYGGDPTKIFLAGHSAGAHIATMLGLDERYLLAAGVAANPLQGVIGISGPYDFDPNQYDFIAPVFAGGKADQVPQPIAYVDGGEPPFLLLHGTDDVVVPQDQSQKLRDALQAAGGTASAVFYPEVGHNDIILDLSLNPLRPGTALLADIKSFIDTQLQTSAQSR